MRFEAPSRYRGPLSWMCSLGAVLTLLLAGGTVRAEAVRVRLRSSAAALAGSDATVRRDLRARGWSFASGRLPERCVPLVIPRGQLLDRVEVTELGREALTGAAWEHVAGKVADSALHAEVDGVAAWCGYQIAFVRLAPFVRGAAGVDLVSDLELEAHTVPGTALPVARQRYNAALAAREADAVRAWVANPEQVQSFAPPLGRATAKQRGFRPAAYPDLEGSDVEYVIVTSEALAPSFQVLADWKTRRGVPTVVRSIESIEANYRHGCDLQETLRTFLQDAYQKWSVSWVLLGGNTEIIPARYLSSSFAVSPPEQIPCDLYFAGLDGTWNADGDPLWGEAAPAVGQPDPDGADLLADVYVARLPVSSPALVASVVQKIIAYETPADPTYQNTDLFLGEVLFPADWDTSQSVSLDGAQLSQTIIDQRIPPSVSLQRRYENLTDYPGSLPLTRDLTIADMNAGFNLVNHIGHGFRYNMSLGDRSLVNSDADGLANRDRYFIANILNCTSLAFDYSCLGEHFITNPGGGAVGVVGASRSAYPIPAREYQDDFYDLIYTQGVWRLGEIFARSRLNQTPLAQAESAHRWTHYIYNVLGEPEMAVFSGLPAALDVLLPAGAVLGPNDITVTVRDAGLVPITGARVCLQKGVEDYQVGTTLPGGSLTLPFTAESAGSIQVTVSGRNLRTWMGTIPVGTSGDPYVHLQSLTVDDDNNGGTSGNGNGILDAGETADLTPVLVNDGGAAAPSVSGSASVSDPNVTVLSGTLTAGAVAAGGTVTAAPLRLRFLAATPDQHAFDLVLSIGAGSSSSQDHVRRLVHAPQLQLVRLQVIDTSTGNGNGEIDVGEEYELRAYVKNYGSGRVDALTAVVQATALSDVEILQGNSSYAAIAPLAEGGNTATFHLRENTLDENRFNLRLTDNRGRLVVLPFETRRPSAPAAPALDPSTGPTTVIVTWPAVADPDLAGYNVYRGLSAGGPWTRATVDYTRGIRYFRDTGLLTSTRYYYTVAAIDTSGNESPRSPATSTSTNPPQVGGWPIDMMAETSSSPAIGDVDGDGAPEVLQGDARVYGWHGNGIEILDADGDPQTWGVFSTQTGTTTASVALGELDGSGGLEILSCDWADNKVFALDGDGSVLWMRQPANGNPPGYWGTPAIADVDRDGHNEVFAMSKDGRLYAWNHDGSPLRSGNADGTFATLSAWTRSSVAIGNLDTDAQLEIVITDVAGNLWAWNPDGSSLPGFPKAYGAPFYNSPVLGDVDGDGGLEIVAVSQGSGNNFHCLRGNGTELPGFPLGVVEYSAAVTPTPALADLDLDGKLEIVVPSNEYSSSNSKVYVYRWNGTLYPGWPQLTGTDSESCPVVADFDGDGNPDIAFGGQDGLLRGWRRDGTELLGFPLSVGDFIRGTPAAGDVDGDGGLDLVLAGWNKRVYVWDFPTPWNPALAQWPAFRHDAQRTGLYGYQVHDATDSGEPRAEAVPRRVELSQNVPNPFNPATVIRYGVPTGGWVRLQIYDVHGRLMRTLVDAPRAAGYHRDTWDGRDHAGRVLPSGIYFYRLRCDGAVRARRMLLLK